MRRALAWVDGLATAAFQKRILAAYLGASLALPLLALAGGEGGAPRVTDPDGVREILSTGNPQTILAVFCVLLIVALVLIVRLFVTYVGKTEKKLEELITGSIGMAGKTESTLRRIEESISLCHQIALAKGAG